MVPVGVVGGGGVGVVVEGVVSGRSGWVLWAVDVVGGGGGCDRLCVLGWVWWMVVVG